VSPTASPSIAAAAGATVSSAIASELLVLDVNVVERSAVVLASKKKNLRDARVPLHGSARSAKSVWADAAIVALESDVVIALASIATGVQSPA